LSERVPFLIYPGVNYSYIDMFSGQ